MLELPTRETSLLEAAAIYLDLGFRPIPVYGIRDDGKCGCGGRCSKPGKHPIGEGWQKRAARTFEEARTLFEGHVGNIGACVQDTPFVVIDFDGAEGQATLDSFESEGIIPKTLRAKSGSGGTHLFYELAPHQDVSRLSDRSKILPGLDIKKEGQVLAAPSRHVSGGYYEWIDAVPIVRLPDALFEKIKTKNKAPVTAPPPVSIASGNNIVERARAYVARMPAAISGQGGHNATYNVARKLLKDMPDLPESSAWSILLEYNQRCEPPWSEKELRHKFDDAREARVSNPIPDRPRLYAVQGGAALAVAPPDPKLADSWREHLLFTRSKTGRAKIVTHLRNVLVILGEDPRWKGKLRYDEFRGRVLCTDPPWSVYERPTEAESAWTDEDATRLHAWLRTEFHEEGGFAPSVIDCERAVDVVARANGFHPVRQYLLSTEWDRTARLRATGPTYFGADASEYVSNVFQWWMISAVARVMQPGCKADHVLILEGGQGIGKSTALGILGGEWFSDTPIDLNSKEAYGQIRGKWLVELAELDSLFRVEASRAKAFFSSPVDNYRPAYGRREREQPRQCVFAGSVNEDAYLRDPTGARRFWPVLCRKTDVAALRRDRDQLWAEAVSLYYDGAKWWPEGDELVAAREVQEERTEVDDWETKVRVYLADKQETTSAEVLEHALRLDTKDWSKAAQMRVGNVLRRLQWTKHRTREGKIRSWSYRGPNHPSMRLGQE